MRLFQQGLEFRRAEQNLHGSVGIVVHQFDTWHQTAGCELVREGLRTDQIAPDFGAQVRRVNSAKNAMPVSVIPLPAQHAVPGLLILRRVFGAGPPRGNGSHRSGGSQHFFVQKVGLGIFSKEAPPRASPQKRQYLRP